MKPANSKLSYIRSWMKNELGSTFGEKEASSITDILLLQMAGIDKLEVIRNPDRILPDEDMGRILRAIDRVKSHEPVQYVTGLANFRGLELRVNNKVLIPRPETEELVDWVIRDHADNEDLKIIDIGTGSGCIALALASELIGTSVTALDSDMSVLEVAAQNALRLGLAIKFVHADILDPEQFAKLGIFDLIISNPPYVRLSGMSGMDRNVLDHEPHGALFVTDEDPLVFYRGILHFMNGHLAENGSAYLEINEDLGKEVVSLFLSAGYNGVTLRKDINGKDRMVRISHRSCS